MKNENKNEILLETIKKLEIELEQKNILINKLTIKNNQSSTDALKSLNDLILINKIISHDLANPISIIQMCAEFISEQDIDEQTKSMIQRIERSATAMSNILKQSREIQAIFSGKKNLQLKAISFKDIINEIKFYFQAKLSEKNIQLVIDSEVDLDTTIETDKEILIQNILNRIIDNSIKYSHQNSSIFLKIKSDSNKYIFSICDQGIGMSNDAVENLFSLDKKYSRQGTKGENGYFLSMPIISQSIKLLNLESNVSSYSEEVDQINHGTIFNLKFSKAA